MDPFGYNDMDALPTLIGRDISWKFLIVFAAVDLVVCVAVILW